MPASSEKMLAKARQLPADEIVIDLEDAVAPDAKEEARAAACAATHEDWGTRSVAVRVNGPGTQWWERDLRDLAEAAGPALGAVVIPMVETGDQIEEAERLLGADGGAIGLQALIETAAGLVALGAIAGAGTRLEALIIGYADLTASLGRPPGDDYPGDRWHFVRDTVLVHARAGGLAAIDGPYLELGDESGLRERAQSARALGFDGKWAIHPNQVGPLNEVFSPTDEELERATAVIEALDRAAQSESRGAVRLDGAMIDEASRKQAAQIVERGRAASGPD